MPMRYVCDASRIYSICLLLLMPLGEMASFQGKKLGSGLLHWWHLGRQCSSPCLRQGWVPGVQSGADPCFFGLPSLGSCLFICSSSLSRTEGSCTVCRTVCANTTAHPYEVCSPTILSVVRPATP
ncbi:uncharacterized protein LY79DRAFT_541569 [Colletotrichum navitas]|uniref:Uncharacterized protein n=1 Tax=Colletotrichum navitas TaxID=681940 RepID=A0AAD8Q856_9PEZI|nr:uncharacterized protein LY79DRAFT_541569 [Colletotrichum navitas]KAK1597414.1 hypothetical protein LY79DRAFT_541569 [Colletotrichum navitas]